MGRHGAVLGAGWRLGLFPNETPPKSSPTPNATVCNGGGGKRLSTRRFQECIDAEREILIGLLADEPFRIGRLIRSRQLSRDQ